MPDKSGELRVYDARSEQTRVLAKTELGDMQPMISPDGSQIAFQNKIGSNTEICLIKSDGSGSVNLTQDPARDMSPSFSPDGKQIAFVTNREGNTAGFIFM
jgi:TolB protein